MVLSDWVVKASLITIIFAIIILAGIHTIFPLPDSLDRTLADNFLFAIIDIGGSGLFAFFLIDRSRRRRQSALQSELYSLISDCILRVGVKVSNFVRRCYSETGADVTGKPQVVDLITNSQAELIRLRGELADIYNYIEWLRKKEQSDPDILILTRVILTRLTGEFIKDAKSESERLFVLLERAMRESEEPKTISIMSHCDTYNREYCRRSDRNEDVISILKDFNEFFEDGIKLQSLMANELVNESPKRAKPSIKRLPLDFICDPRA